MDVKFRPLTDRDLPLLHGWLNEPGVVRWWEGDDVTYQAVVRDYGATSTEPVEHWIASSAGRDFGWVQCYAIADYRAEDEPQAWLQLGVDETAAGIDYLIGDPPDRGRGLGSAMIRSFVERIVFPRHPGWTQVCASPVAANIASWRALAKAGFEFGGAFDSRFGRCRLMVLRRPAPAHRGHPPTD